MGYLAILSASEGRRAGFAAVAGVALGLLAVGLAASLGLAALISGSVLAYNMLRWCGILYLLWLARDGWMTAKETSPGNAVDSGQDHKYFRRGFITNLLNPKAAVFYIAILPGFVNTAYNIMTQTIMLTFTYVSLATLIHCLIVALAGTAGFLLNNSRYNLLIRRAMSLLLVCIAIWFAYDTSGISP